MTTLTNDQITSGAAVLCTECGLNCQPGACVYAPSPQIAEKVELLPLPEPKYCAVDLADIFTVEQMQQYARDAIAASRRAAAPASAAQAAPADIRRILNFAANVIELFDDKTMEGNYMLDASECAGIIRALSDYLAAQPAEVSAGQACQVANKAEVDLSKLPLHHKKGVENGGYYLATDVIRLLSTPPATTGASTVRDQEAEPSEISRRASRTYAYVNDQVRKDMRSTEREVAAKAGQVATGDLLPKRDAADEIVLLSNVMREHPQLKPVLGREALLMRCVRKALAAPVAAGQVAVPEGFVLAPDEPTDQMTYIGQKMRYDPANSIGSIYCAMLAAAPSPAKESK